MYQVGQSGTFSIEATTSTLGVYSYVWKWWDNTVEATSTGTVVKTFSIGGDPTDTSKLWYEIVPVMQDGRSTSFYGTIQVNNPPVLALPPVVANNDDFFPFTTQVTVYAIDLEGSPLTFAWFKNSVPDGAGSSSVYGAVNYTWKGNEKEITAPYTAVQNVYTTSIGVDTTLLCEISDPAGAKTSVTFDMRGQQRPPPTVGIYAEVSSSGNASSVPTIRVGANNSVSFSIYARDEGGAALTFLWHFASANGWTMPPEYAAGSSQLLEDGGYLNTVVRNIAGEIATDGAVKTCTAEVRIFSPTAFADAQFSITLLPNHSPTGVYISAKDQTGAPVLDGDTHSAGTFIFAIHGTDPDGDPLTGTWAFFNPTHSPLDPYLKPTILRLWGPEVTYNAGHHLPGDTIQGDVTVSDNMGADIAVQTPLIQIV